MSDKTARILVRMPEALRKKLKIIAAMSSRSLNEQIIAYICNGIASSKFDLSSVTTAIYKTDEN